MIIAQVGTGDVSSNHLVKMVSATWLRWCLHFPIAYTPATALKLYFLQGEISRNFFGDGNIQFYDCGGIYVKCTFPRTQLTLKLNLVNFILYTLYFNIDHFKSSTIHKFFAILHISNSRAWHWNLYT